MTLLGAPRGSSTTLASEKLRPKAQASAFTSCSCAYPLLSQKTADRGFRGHFLYYSFLAPWRYLEEQGYGWAKGLDPRLKN